MTHISGQVLQLGLYLCRCPLSEDVCSLLLLFLCLSRCVCHSQPRHPLQQRLLSNGSFTPTPFFFFSKPCGAKLPNSREQLNFILHILVRCCSFCYLFHSRAKIHKHVELAFFPIVNIIKET